MICLQNENKFSTLEENMKNKMTDFTFILQFQSRSVEGLEMEGLEMGG